jgi:hypothetical protein
LHVSQSLNLSLLLFLDSLLFADFCLFTFDLLAIELCNFVIDALFGGSCSDLLLLSILVRDPDFFIQDLDLSSLGGKFFNILSLGLLDVGFELCFFEVGLVLELLAVDLTVCDLVDDNLSASLSSLCCTLLPIHLLLDSFQTLDLHHHIESLLLLDPVLFEKSILFQLPVPNSHDFRLENELVHPLHIIVSFVNRILNIGQKRVVLIRLDFDLKRCILLPLSVLSLHLVFTRIGCSHLLCLLFIHHGSLLLHLLLLLNDDFLANAVQVRFLDYGDLRVVLFAN